MGEDESGAAEFEKECENSVLFLFKGKCKADAELQTPQHRVSIKGFLMGKYEVTQRQWKSVMGVLPAELEKLDKKFKSDDKPVVMVSWEEVQQFLKKLGKGYRLPSEAEWEYAARAGKRTAYGFGAEITPEIVNYYGNYPAGKTAEGLFRKMPVVVGSLGVGNRFGLYDMHGNVWEWCEDQYRENYNGAPIDGRAWIGMGMASSRVIRGGGWFNEAIYCRSAYRRRGAPGYRYADLGFRLSRTLP